MTSSGKPQPNELDSIVLDTALPNAALPNTALLEAHMPAIDTGDNSSNGVPAQRADELVDCHYEAVYRYAYRLSGCATTAEDIVQETFVQAIRHLHQLRSREAERGWLLAIARRQFMRVLRKAVHKQHGRMVSIDNPNVDVESVLCEHEQLPRPLQAIEDQDCVQRALSQLGPDARLVIVMHYFEELSYAEIAAQLEIPMGTVMSRLSRSREQLRKLLDESVHQSAPNNAVASPLAQPHLACPNLSQEARHG